eukprot:9358946-Pyramimonas_sp.AAC.5
MAAEACARCLHAVFELGRSGVVKLDGPSQIWDGANAWWNVAAHVCYSYRVLAVPGLAGHDIGLCRVQLQTAWPG